MGDKRLLRLNLVFLVLFFVLCLFGDANGRVLGLSEAKSAVIVLAVWVPGVCAAGVLIARGSGWTRVLGIVLEVLYLGLMLPVIVPW